MKDNSSRLYINAYNVHQGGGKALLDALISAIPNNFNTFVQLDRRMEFTNPLRANLGIRLISPSIFYRFIAEWWLVGKTKSTDTVLCFGNLPPLFRLRGHVVLFIQNRYLIDDVRLDKFPFKIRLRLVVERIWLFTRIGNVSEIVVQTPSMKAMLEQRLNGRRIPVRILPFMKETAAFSRSTKRVQNQGEKKPAFLYVASGEPHKNHIQLINAWCSLAKEGFYPLLKLTIDQGQFSQLCLILDEKIEKHNLNIENLGNLSHKNVKQLYECSTVLIYPSTFESFGLPLIEARQYGLDVIASELDYVRDIVDPEQTFDPKSATSIARSVRRYLGHKEQGLKLENAEGFLNKIIKRSNGKEE